MSEKYYSVAIIFLFTQAIAIWPPSYKINLSHEETFVISELLSSDDTDDIYDVEDEMIKEKELKEFNLEKDSAKYFSLHKLTMRRNSKDTQSGREFYNKKRLDKTREVNSEQDELKPWESGFANKKGNFRMVYRYIQSESLKKNQKNITRKNVRQQKIANISSDDANYDYGSLKAEYYSNIKEVKTSNETLNYTEVKEEENFNDAVKAIIGDKTKPQNCTIEERKGIGLGAAKCFWSDLRKPNLSKNERSAIFHRIGTIILIWFLVYVLIAIPCWCQKGWCCCCFQCKFCRPQERIDSAKKYLTDNPLGVYHTRANKKITYTPNSYEKYAQRKLEKALLKL